LHERAQPFSRTAGENDCAALCAIANTNKWVAHGDRDEQLRGQQFALQKAAQIGDDNQHSARLRERFRFPLRRLCVAGVAFLQWSAASSRFFSTGKCIWATGMSWNET
jgi:hypothetical protein